MNSFPYCALLNFTLLPKIVGLLAKLLKFIFCHIAYYDVKKLVSIFPINLQKLSMRLSMIHFSAKKSCD